MRTAGAICSGWWLGAWICLGIFWILSRRHKE